ncbi:hypothetical protein [Phormidium tenue]|uniref:hypothetical protein n=1 Tax=Phormidium tenue TaxID=126344 RepID=UPI0011153C57|nr:hypothetical protein [Phormidium tenue]MBD2231285.1 hypothetical protein [Phormidium tenue FACHB-1052]
MKANWMVLPLVLGLSSLTVACDTAGNTETEEELETETNGLETGEGEEEEEGGEEGGGDD